jgi:hypothetical protein
VYSSRCRERDSTCGQQYCHRLFQIFRFCMGNILTLLLLLSVSSSSTYEMLMVDMQYMYAQSEQPAYSSLQVCFYHTTPKTIMCSDQTLGLRISPSSRLMNKHNFKEFEELSTPTVCKMRPASRMRSFYLCDAAGYLISETWKKKIWNSTNNYWIRIHKKYYSETRSIIENPAYTSYTKV